MSEDVPPHIVDAARHVLAQDGLAAATLARISTAAGVSRMTRALEALCGVTERNLALLEALSASMRGAIYHDRGPARLSRKVFIEPLERLLLDGAADDSLAPVDAEEAATVLFNAVGHTYRHLRSGHQWSATRARDGIVGLAMSGVIRR